MLNLKKIVIPKNELYDLYVCKNYTSKDIAKIYGTSTITINRRLKEYGIAIKKPNRKYLFNESYFDIIDTKDKAYLLGLIASDGWVAKGNKRGNTIVVGLSLHQNDKEVVEYFKQQLQSPVPLKRNGNNIQITVCSTHMCKSLEKYGIVPNKSLIISLEDVINKANMDDGLIPSFLLGYFDGDGGIRYCYGSNGKTIQWRCSFTGTNETCLFLQRYFGEGKIIKENTPGENTYTYSLSGTNQVFRNLNKLYESHNSFCMERKHSKFLVLKSLVK